MEQDALLQNVLTLLSHLISSFGGLFLVIVFTAIGLKLLYRPHTGPDRQRYRRQLLAIGIWLVALVAGISSLPIAEGLRNQLLTLTGLVVTATITLSSTTMAGNAMAGLMLRILDNFRPGDFVQVEGYFGRVSETSLFHTEIQTEDRDLITLPNMFMTTHPVKVVHATGTIVTAEVTLGYDVHRKQIQELLVTAGENAGLTDVFVLITSLGDFSVAYRVCGLLDKVKTLISARSTLRACMLDALHEAGIEIVSPNFMNQRQVPEPVIPSAPLTVRLAEPENVDVEKNVFDKAERASQLEELKDQFDEISAEIKKLEDELKDCSEEEKEELSTFLNKRMRRRKAIQRALQYFNSQE